MRTFNRCVALAAFTLFNLQLAAFAEPEEDAQEPASLEELQKIPASKFSKVIRKSNSPDERLAVVVGSLDGSEPKWTAIEYRDGDKSFIVDADRDDRRCRNYLVDVRSDKVIGILSGRHFGTNYRYNHEVYRIAWSPNGCWFTETQSWKWDTETCVIYWLNQETDTFSRFDFNAEAGDIVDRWLKQHAPHLEEDIRRNYGVIVSEVSIDNDGILSANILGHLGKDDTAIIVDVKVTAELKLTAKGDLEFRVAKIVPVEE